MSTSLIANKLRFESADEPLGSSEETVLTDRSSRARIVVLIG